MRLSHEDEMTKFSFLVWLQFTAFTCNRSLIIIKIIKNNDIHTDIDIPQHKILVMVVESLITLNGTPRKDANRPDSVESVQIFMSAGSVGLLFY